MTTFVKSWWAFVLRGVFAVLFGILSFAFPGVTMLSLVLLFALYACAGGALALVAAVVSARQGGRWGWMALEGLVSILAGIWAISSPGLTVALFILLLAAWALISGVLTFVAAFHVAADHGRWWLVLGGLASIAYGALLFLAPVTGAVVLTWWIGAYAIVFGIALITFGLRLRGQVNRA